MPDGKREVFFCQRDAKGRSLNMAIQDIQSPLDRRLLPFQNIQDRYYAERSGLFVVEGRANMRRLATTPNIESHSFLLTPTAYEALKDALGTPSSPASIYRISPQHLNEVAGYRVHRGGLALGRRPPPLEMKDLLENGPADVGRLLLVENIGNPENMGALFRNARAFGLHSVLLGPKCVDPLYRRCIRVSMGASFMLRFLQVEHWLSLVEGVRASGYRVVALDPAGLSIDRYSQKGWPKKLALMVGHEGDGLSPESLAVADQRCAIPMVPGMDSINVATAAAIAMQRSMMTPAQSDIDCERKS